MVSISRRRLLTTAAPWALTMTALGGPLAFASPSRPRFAAATPFSYERLRERAKALSQAPYISPHQTAADVLGKINFDTVQKIKFRGDRSLWNTGPGAYPVRLFHLNEYTTLPVRIHTVTNGAARELIYAADDFDYGTTGLDRQLPQDLGYSGFRLMDGPAKETDWMAFQGASYFRCAGEEAQYGASARGIAVNTALNVPEEFPRFVEFWLSEPDDGSPVVTIYALLDGPSVTGAYRFDATKDKGAAINVKAELFMRGDIDRLGVAPLTSMFWYNDADRRLATDWRPAIHDSDGLALRTGTGERVWRPLLNPTSVRTNSFVDANPQGFGLMQRNRDFAAYEDDGAFYNRRPSIWVEPVGDWGEGAVQLVEIPTIDEIHDNIVAYWQPKAPAKRGDELAFSYKLYFSNDEPNPPDNLGRVVATRTGAGGVPGRPESEDTAKRKYVIDFSGGPLDDMAQRFDVTPVVSTSRGKVDNAYVIKVVGTDKWRALFDLSPEGGEPIDLRCYLRLDDKTLTETWLYQYLPDAKA
jgi:periplasmic glucans biosynthesis protein